MTRSHEEHDIQCQFIAAARHVKGCEWIFAIPNAVPGGVKTQMWMNREGRKAGVLDIFNPVPSKREWMIDGMYNKVTYGGLWMETKTRLGKLTPEQARFIIHADSVGYGVAVYRSVQQGIDILLGYMRGAHSNDAAVREAKRKLKI
jgi:hypothetical protein